MQTRNTRQKEVISRILEESHRPLTAQEVLTKAKRRIPTLGIATVYREISRLCEAGQLHNVTIPGDTPRYEVSGHHHHHFKCTGCESVFELEGCIKDIARLVPRGFRHQAHDITLFGLCRNCA